ncbi:MAG: ATP-dependent protease [Gammaproteobacteria bacterium SG8_11]|nr:MAG: ATP-dependent protease [Gammaproteobacteria bacterium SG8_11]
MAGIKALKTHELYSRIDSSQLKFSTTDELEILDQIVGQERAMEALHFGVHMRKHGYNLFVHGPSGLGKETIVRQFLEKYIEGTETPPDWCYVHRFDQPHKPNAMILPAGRGKEFKSDMSNLVDELRSVIPSVFETDEYHAKIQELEERFAKQREQAFAEFEKDAEKRGIKLLRTRSGFTLAPIKDGHVISPEEYDTLSKEDKKQYEKEVDILQDKLSNLIRQEPRWQRELRGDIKKLNREVATLAVEHLIEELKTKYQDVDEVGEYLDEVQKDVVDNVDEFLKQDDRNIVFKNETDDLASYRRYQVNLLVDHSDSKGVPIIYEDNPVYQNLIGRVEHFAHMGTLITDFMLIKPGALHKANGGFLVLDARKLLLEPFAWEGLKRALKAKEIRIQSLGELYSFVSTVSLDPEAIALDTKVVLFGDRFIYYLLQAYDPEFCELFKVAADFDVSIDRSAENIQDYAHLVGSLIKKQQLQAFDKDAVARVMEYASRKMEDADKLSTHMRSIVDLISEADYFANEDGNKIVLRKHVQKAIDAQIRRVDRMRSKIYEEIERGTILLQTEGEKIGQVNALSVIDLGNFSFGQPSRVTASVHVGEGGVVDIEREVELGGPIHSKGVFILSAFLSGRYARKKPLSMSASLTFEQSYGMIDGDSASVAELCALLSAIGEIPIKQNIALTGSVNQHGEVQAIGGVNEKIEGFFDVCKNKGLTGDQAVLIPQSNVKHLMLRNDVVEAVGEGRFQIYPIETIDQAIETLTGLKAGELNKQNKYPKGSVNYKVTAKLAEYADIRHEFAKSESSSDSEK